MNRLCMLKTTPCFTSHSRFLRLFNLKQTSAPLLHLPLLHHFVCSAPPLWPTLKSPSLPWQMHDQDRNSLHCYQQTGWALIAFCKLSMCQKRQLNDPPAVSDLSKFLKHILQPLLALLLPLQSMNWVTTRAFRHHNVLLWHESPDWIHLFHLLHNGCWDFHRSLVYVRLSRTASLLRTATKSGWPPQQ